MTITSETAETTSADVGGLPRGWRQVRFGDMVRQVKADVKPETSGLERYVAGEHMETDDLHIRHWGTIGDGYLGPAFHRKFVKGQVLYGSRRTYLRKVAVAEFDGICANTTFVLEPADDQVLSDLLPFIMQTDAFNEHSVKQSKGSVNPYVNFSDLAWYEFALPPKDEQRRIAEILWAAERAIMAYQDAESAVDATREAVVENVANITVYGADTTLNDILLNCQYGSSARSGQYTDGAVPILRIPNVVRGKLDLTDLNWVTLSSAEVSRFSVGAQDILLVRTNGNPAYVGRCCIVDSSTPDAVYASYLIRLRVDRTKALPEYVAILINSRYLRKTLRHEIRSSAGNYNINTVGIRRQRIPLPSLVEQQAVANHVAALDDASEKLQGHIDRLRNLKQLILNSMSTLLLGDADV